MTLRLLLHDTFFKIDLVASSLAQILRLLFCGAGVSIFCMKRALLLVSPLREMLECQIYEPEPKPRNIFTANR